MSKDKSDDNQPTSRLRRALMKSTLWTAGGLSLSSLFPASSIAAKAQAASDSHVCVLTPEQIAGPYFRNTKLIRRNISEGENGIPLLLKLKIIDTTKCEPVSNAFVDIWHCNSRGGYSGWAKISPDLEAVSGEVGSIQRTDDETYLRGSQYSDADGIVRFTTIFPGFYAGRATHIHVAVRELGANILEDRHVVFVGQMYFPERASNEINQLAQYDGREISRLTNDNDEFYTQMRGDASTLTVKRIVEDSVEDGVFAELVIGVDMNATSQQIQPSDFNKHTV
ncbi:MAG: intradiol ring-cleavage dioxygenase [Pseudomonas sp.]|nr:intradiol ring-cleavage dioxygenase [Pseudomonas sp.]